MRRHSWLVCILGIAGCRNNCRSSLLFGEEQFCDPAKELTFLEVGDVEGDWFRVDEVGEEKFGFSFDSEGHFDYWYFGCRRNGWPLVENGLNSWESYGGYGWNSLEGYEIRPGYFRLDFLTQGDEEVVEGRLMPDGSFHLESADAMALSGVYFKADKADDEDASSTSGADGAEESPAGSGGGSTESNETSATGSEN